MASAYYVSPEGDVVEAPAEEAEARARLGYAPASPEQAADFQGKDALAKEYGTDGQAAIAGAEAAGRALSFGLSTPLERALGVSKEGIAAREELNPTAAGVGTAIGIAAPLVATAGAAAAPEALAQGGVRGALAAASEVTAPALAARIARGATEALGGASEVLEGTGVHAFTAPGLIPEATSVAGRIARQAAAYGLGSAIEGAAYGAGDVVHEAALGDPNLTAEHAAATIGMSALLGGGIGGLLGAATVGVPAAARAARDTIAGAFRKGEEGIKGIYASAEAATGVPGDVATYMIEHKLEIAAAERTAPGITEDIANATPEMAKFIVDNGPRLSEMEQAFPGTTRQIARADPQTASYLLDNWQKIFTDQNARNEVAKGLFEGAKSVIDTTNELLTKANKEILPAEREQLLAEIRGFADRRKVELARQDILGRVETTINKMRAEPDLYSPAYVRELEVMGEGLTRDLAPPAKGWRPPDEVFDRLRTFKQQMGELSDFGKDRLGMTRADRNATREIAGLWGATKGTLVDERLFGRAAVRQAMLDDIQHEWISLMGKKGAFYKQFMTQGERGAELKTTKISTWLNQMANPKSGMQGDLRGREAAAIWGRMMDAAKRVVNEVEQSARTANVSADFDGVRSILEKAEAATATAQERAAVTLTKAGLEGRTLLSSHPIVSPAASVAGQAAAALVPSAVRSAVNIARGTVNVPRTVAVLAALERAGTAATRRIESLSSTLARAGAKATSVGRAETLAGVARSFGHETPRVAADFAKVADRVRTLNQSPEAMYASLERSSDDLHEHAPNTAQALQMASIRAVQFLASKLPAAPSQGPLAPKWEPSRAELAKFNRYAEAVDDPIAVLKQAAAGTLTPEAVEAVKTVYPELFNQRIVPTIMAQLAKHPGQTPYRTRLMLSMLLGQDVDGSIASTAANQAALRGPSQKASERPTAPAGAKAVTLAERMQTDSQGASSRR